MEGFELDPNTVGSLQIKLLVDILVNVLATQEFIIEYIKDKKNDDENKLDKLFDETIQRYWEKVSQNIYENYGKIDLSGFWPKKNDDN